MLGGERVIALVPARGGSKTVPRKNLQLLGDRPLIGWPIRTALATAEIDRVLVSTDDAEIGTVARELGAEVYERPESLSGDSALVVDLIRHLAGVLGAEGESARILVLLEATSPFRSAGLVGRCVRRLVEEDLDSLATFSEAEVNPARVWRIEAGVPSPFLEGAVPWQPRQALPEAYQLNGAVYVMRTDRLPETGPSVLFGRVGAEIIPRSSVVDIDDMKDLVIANGLLESGFVADHD